MRSDDSLRSSMFLRSLPRLLVFTLLFIVVGLIPITSAKSQAIDLGFPAARQVSGTITTYLPVVLGSSNVILGSYVLLGWNDLGMHCYNRDFQDLAVLPPYNTLWAQVIKRGDPPQIVTQGIRVQYTFPDNKTSSNKSNFWTYAPQLFGVTLANNIGLKGKGLTDVMDLSTDHFIAEGIPLTEYSDSAPTLRNPYQQAEITAKNATTGEILATLTVVAPVSTEMRCDNCHASGKKPGGNQARVELNILAYHDRKEGTNLMTQRPVLCANCHGSNALGYPEKNGIPSLSNAMHAKHAGEVPDTIDGCYMCHPGPTTKCLRDVMSSTVPSKIDSNRKMNCIDCHGGMSKVRQNPNPWLNEPRCDTCHVPTQTAQYNQDQALYRFSKGHGGVYCEACHDSAHAIAASSEPADAIKFIQLQGKSGTLSKCTVCHLTQPTGPGPHQK